MSFQTISSVNYAASFQTAVVDPRLTVHVLKRGSWCNVGKTENRRCIVEYCFVPKKGVVRFTTSAWNKVLIPKSGTYSDIPPLNYSLSTGRGKVGHAYSETQTFGRWRMPVHRQRCE